MKTIKISPNYIGYFFRCLIPLYTINDPEQEELSELNFENRSSIRRLANEYLIPCYQRLSISDQFRIKESLRYAMNLWSDEILHTQYTYGIPPEILTKEFLMKIWDDMFNGEDIFINDASNYKIIDFKYP